MPPPVFSPSSCPTGRGWEGAGCPSWSGAVPSPRCPLAGLQDAAAHPLCPQHPRLGRTWLSITSRGSRRVRAAPGAKSCPERCQSTHGIHRPDRPCSLLPRRRSTVLVPEVGAGTSALSPVPSPVPWCHPRCHPGAAGGLPSLLLAGSVDTAGSPAVGDSAGPPGDCWRRCRGDIRSW